MSNPRALKRYLIDKNLMHGRETATISNFGTLISEKYFSYTFCFFMREDLERTFGF